MPMPLPRVQTGNTISGIRNPETQTRTLCLVSMSAYLPRTGAGTKSTSGDSTPRGDSGSHPDSPNPSLTDFRGYPSVTDYSTI